MLEKLKEKNEQLLEANKENPNELKKYQIIKKILEKPDCFLNISIEYAYAILRDLQIPEKELKSTYIQLISFNENSIYQEKPLGLR